MDHLDSSAGLPRPDGFLATASRADVHSLGLLQRILLVSDGTLTDMVEAAFQEPIQLVKLTLDLSPAVASMDELELTPGDPLMSREILLQGGKTGRNYVYAKSFLAIDSLPPKLRHELVSTDRPLGRLWVEHKLETRKEILKVWRHRNATTLAHFPDARGELVARSYRVFCGGRPIMLITEHFPAE